MKRLSLNFTTMLMIVLMCLPFALTSCEEKDEEVSGLIVYSMGFESIKGDLSEMATIEKTYKNVLGIGSLHFTMEGKISECDQKVVDACKKAETQLASRTFNGSFAFYVNNNNSNKRIYFYQIN